jgi:hypothetical protein
MNRKEEIQQKASEEAWYIADTSQTKEEAAIRGYCLGAAYADRTMLDRACEWMGNELKETDDRNGYPTVESLSFVSVKEFINEFRQAMEGGAE